MAWPTTTIDTTQMDNTLDDPSQARAEIRKMADNVNSIKDAKGQANGIAELDPSTLLPTTQLPLVPVNKGGTNQSTYTVGDILYASASGVLSKLAAGTSGYVLKSNGPGAAPSWQQESGGLISGTRILFQQTTPPIGWTKETNSVYNNAALRIVTGTVSNGGADDFTTVFGASKSTASHTLTLAQVPAHDHEYPNSGIGGTFTKQVGNYTISTVNTATAVVGASNRVVSQGGGGAHSHGLALDLKYRDVVIAQKD